MQALGRRKSLVLTRKNERNGRSNIKIYFRKLGYATTKTNTVKKRQIFLNMGRYITTKENVQ